jgi:hypothetical protein
MMIPEEVYILLVPLSFIYIHPDIGSYSMPLQIWYTFDNPPLNDAFVINEPSLESELYVPATDGISVEL